MSASRLTAKQIRQAIDSVEEEEENIGSIGEDEEANDEFTDSENDEETEETDEEDDADYDGSDNGEMFDEMVEEYHGRDGTVWRNAPHYRRHHHAMRINRSALNKVNLMPGQYIESEEDAFKMIFTNEVFEKIVKHTNEEANRVHNRTNTRWKAVDVIEIRAFVGLLISAGVDRASKKNYRDFF